MSLLKASRSLLLIPSDYGQVRPHHLLVLYGAVRLVTSLCLPLCKHISDKLLSLISAATEKCIPLIQMGFVPDFLIRFGIRLQLRDHLNILRTTQADKELAKKQEIVLELHTMPIAIKTTQANEQHYEVPARFYDLCLGPRKKYSSGLWPTKDTTFEESEVLMLDLYCERAGLQDGMTIVDLGCGWGSLTLHIAERFPNCKITAISNSHSQREYILATAAARGYNVNNITIVTVRNKRNGTVQYSSALYWRRRMRP
jgi:cyclopropane-fatty-acyl-phospholipid synthase